MSVVSVTNVIVGRNPARLTDPFELEVSFECLEGLQKDLEWRLVYVGDPEDKSKDQELDCVALGPVQRGALRFVFVADAPDFRLIKKEDINGITIILLTGSYRNQEFVRVGWYVHNFLPESEYVENPPDIDEMPLEEMLAKMQRVILAEAPRVTRFQIDWDPPSHTQQDTLLVTPNLHNGATTTPLESSTLAPTPPSCCSLTTPCEAGEHAVPAEDHTMADTPTGQSPTWRGTQHERDEGCSTAYGCSSTLLCDENRRHTSMFGDSRDHLCLKSMHHPIACVADALGTEDTDMR